MNSRYPTPTRADAPMRTIRGLARREVAAKSTAPTIRETRYTPMRFERAVASSPSPYPSALSVPAYVESGPWAPSRLMPMRKAVTCTGHISGRRKTRMSMAGSFWRSSKRTKSTSAATPAASSTQVQTNDGPLRRRNVSEPVTSSSPMVRMTKPSVSSRRPGSGSDSGTPNRITKKHAVTATAGITRVTVRCSAVAAKMRPAARAPRIAPACRPTTSRPAARRVAETPCRARRPRSKIRATSRGSQTT